MPSPPPGPVQRAVEHSVLNALPAQVALLDARGVIVSVNDAWRHFNDTTALCSPAFGLGHDCVALCEATVGPALDDALQAAQGIRAVLGGISTGFSLEYPSRAPGRRHWYRMMVAPLQGEGAGGAVVMHIDIGEPRLAHVEPQRAPGLLEAVVSPVVTAAPGPPPSPSQSLPVDLGVLVALMGNDRPVIEKALQAFRTSALRSGAALNQNVADGQWQAVIDATHKMKSGARSVGARRLGALCEEMEAAAEAGRADMLAGLLARFETELEAVLRFLAPGGHGDDGPA